MKKLFTSLFFVLTVLCSSNAEEVNIKQAEKVALNFYFERADFDYKLNYYDLKITDHFVISGSKVIALHCFNINKGGFVIVSGDNSVLPVLGYSFLGKYSNIDKPPQFEGWINFYVDQIVFAIENKIQTSEKISSLWKHLLTQDVNELINFSGKDEVEPLLTTTWDQGRYYNEMCPIDPEGPGDHTYAGCVATAMGQVMNYFRFPLQGIGSYSYYCPPYDTLSADFGNTTYKWDEMALSLSGSNLAVAELLFHLGVSVDMVYGPNGSGMYNHKAAFSLGTYFKYSPETRYVYRDSTTLDWDSLLITHLDRKIPMYYAGWSDPWISGHAFVCDGYQEGNYYHFNWGWSGSYDGYFYTDALNPGGNNFNLAQEVIINAYPDTLQYQYPYFCQGEKNLLTLQGTIDDGSGPVNDYQNNTNCSWLISPEDSVNYITLEFLSFQTSENDTLFVYDGALESDSLIGAFSGNTIPGTVYSSSDKLLLSFITNDTITDKGWLASYTSKIPEYCVSLTTFTAVGDTFSDGSGSRNYHNNSMCKWLIMPPDAESINLYFTEFKTEEEKDFFRVYDAESQELLAELSGYYYDSIALPEVVTAESGKMYIIFSTNQTITAPGWNAYYTTPPAAIIEFEVFNNLRIFPNPASEKLFIEFSYNNFEPIELKFISICGKTLFTCILNSKNGNYQNEIDLNNYKPGIYFIELKSEKGRIVRKIAIN
ncbi:MAG: C10 family peptidase [Bacteroidales bacterium]|nr:C10 family peptidase [Bacteroidales bacterium]